MRLLLDWPHTLDDGCMPQMSVLLFNTPEGPTACIDQRYYRVTAVSWDELINTVDLAGHLRTQARSENRVEPPRTLLAPIGSQELWGAGVTYYRSRVARREESAAAGGGDFYDRVYEADRPELFLKATPLRVAAPGARMRLRRDSRWMVPEPELTLLINSRHEIIGYTVGNDLSCRDLEGENPLYLPQAKTWDGCAAIGPGLLISDQALPADTRIQLQVLRGAQVVVDDGTELGLMKRSLSELRDYLTRETSFPAGCFLMTGTGIVPADDFSLQPGDEVRITIAPIGTLVNVMDMGQG